ncbi:MAG: S-layer homology domain-containing protein [Eggerthellaceae bacterium]|nr:S-layer homology domain-containing protein [Eggerthellaceae bacterium]
MDKQYMPHACGAFGMSACMRAFVLAFAFVVALIVAAPSFAFAQEMPRQADEPNSWRFVDGQLIQESDLDEGEGEGEEGEEEEPAFIPWSLTPSGYINPAGDLIQGALRKGIDVSSWNADVDWAKVKASGINFAIIRCGYGSDYTDQDDAYFLKNVRGCIENGIEFGLYIYSYAFTVEMAESEADHVLRLLDEAGLSPADLKYPVYLDLEETATTGKPCVRTRNPEYVEGEDKDGDGVEDQPKYLYHYLSNDLLGEMSAAFAAKIDAAGYETGFYASLNWWNNYMTDPVFDGYERWVAQWNYTCSYRGDYSTWQYTSDGSVDGIVGRVDMNFDFDERRCAPLLSDVKANHWYVENGSYTYMVSRGYMSGYANTNLFGPYDTITRGQVATILWRMAGCPEPSATPETLAPFEDVRYSEYYGQAIEWARSVGVITGYQDADGVYRTFGPDRAVSRQEYACMLARYAKLVEDMDVECGAGALSAFPDVEKVATWAADSMAWTVEAGIVSGFERGGSLFLEPGKTASRAEVATMVTRYQMMPRA